MIKDNFRLQFWILGILVLITRIPFLFDGFGHEEDSWGLVVNAWEMHTRGHYVASRFPGHPLQEYIYLLIWNQPAWIYNAFSALFSAAAVLYFFKALRKMGIAFAFETSLMLAFVPVFYIAGTYTIDYAWSLAFIMAAFFYFADRKFLIAGILIGLAVGCRITSGIFIVPIAILLWNRLNPVVWIKQVMTIAIPAGLIGIAWYIPAYLQYGISFFDYSDQFPYPPLAKILYKASLGVFGFLGIAGIAWSIVKWLMSKDKSAQHVSVLFSPKRLTLALIAIIILHIFSYLRLPQKAGYMLPIVPFVLLLINMYSSRATIRIVMAMFVLSAFFCSINLSDSLRGSESSSIAMKFTVSGQEIFFDPLSGPIFSEQSKRQNKMKYTAKVRAAMESSKEKQLIICGWWYNEIVSYYLEGRKDARYLTSPVKWQFYAPCDTLNEYQRNGYQIYYLPEQNLYNDQMFGQQCTDSLASPYVIQ